MPKREISIEELLFTEKHIIALPKNRQMGDTADREQGIMTDESITTAVTLNEILGQSGFTLSPNDIFSLACYNDDVLTYIKDSVQSFTDKVNADPMYPDFPTQVMEIDEAKFRVHQMMHYFSTYGLESILGEEIRHGWLPDMLKTDKTQSDAALLQKTVLHTEEHYQAYEEALRSTLQKKQRFTIPEKDLVSKILFDLSHDPDYHKDPLKEIHIPFKENMNDIFKDIFFNKDYNITQRTTYLHDLCQNTGDVLKCLKNCLNSVKWDLSTSEKKCAVHLLESYPVSDLKENLWRSKQQSEEAKNILKAISYNKFSKDPEHARVVQMARDNKLSSFDSKIKRLLQTDPDRAVEVASSRPGVMLRDLTLLYRNSFSENPEQQLSDALCKHADQLSVPTLVDTISAFDEKMYKDPDNPEHQAIYNVLNNALSEHLSMLETPLRNQKVYIDSGDVSLERSQVLGNKRAADGGFLNFAHTYEIPEDANYVRAFVFWKDDDKRVDVDLHASATKLDGTFVSIGWNDQFRDVSADIVQSGDITYSCSPGSVEYIDIGLNDTQTDKVQITIDYFNGDKFSDINECYAGLMLVQNHDSDIALYDPKNCLVTHELRQDVPSIDYGEINVPEKILNYVGKKVGFLGHAKNGLTDYSSAHQFSLNSYLNTLLESQGAERVESKDDADIVLTFEKASNEKELSLVDENLFYEQPCDPERLTQHSLQYSSEMTSHTNTIDEGEINIEVPEIGNR